MQETIERLKVENLSFSREHNQVILSNISFKLCAGEILGIIGPNGGGKSTLLKLLAGLLDPSSGEILYNDQNGPSSLTYIPQKEMTNLSFPMTIEEFLKGARLPKTDVTTMQAKQALERVELKKPLSGKINNLSGGEYQRVLLAKSYLCQAKVILMDEPTKGLDGVGQDKLLSLIKEYKDEKKASIVLVDHNITQVLRHCDHLLCLNKSYHWHNHKEHLNKKVLESTYHCEFEHLLIHENTQDILEHEHHKCHEHEPGDKK